MKGTLPSDGYMMIEESSLPIRDCSCNVCNRASSRRRRTPSRRNNGGWTPRTTGTTESGETVTFRQGLGSNDGHTLIADGEKSSREFDKGHDHYGQKREGGGRVDTNRGFYTGPGA